MICLKNPLGPGKLSHPALASHITGVFDQIGIDSTEGLPEVDRYHSFILIKDHASKLIMVVPTRGKSAEEAARALWLWICTYGPPKILLSDQGRQFVNETITALVKKFCIKHKITSAYHPETNGAVEIMNKVVVNCLRKLIEENPNDWPTLIPFVVLAYNNKINNITKFSPFVVVFGKPLNGFDDWRTKPGEDEAASLLARSMEIKNMHEVIRPEALKNINKSQIQQRKTQDERSKQILTQSIPIGSTVMLKAEGLNPKLSQKYSGPYTVIDIGKLNNYRLKDSDNNILEKFVNINRLKIINLFNPAEEPAITNNETQDPNLPRTSSSTRNIPTLKNNIPQTKSSIIIRKKQQINELPSVIIEAILGHKKENNRFYYLVKWQDYPDEENEWLESKAFDNKETINEYWRHQTYDLRKPNKTRFLRNNLITIFLFILQFSLGLTFQINGKFKHCKINDNSPFVNIYESCHSFETHAPCINTQVNILEKHPFAIDGYGYECSKTMITFQTRETFWGNKVTNRNEEVINLTPDECNIMVQYKRCEKEKMECVESLCEFKKQPSLEWSYFCH